MPQIETSRLLLRPIEVQDFDRWCDMMRVEANAAFVGGKQSPALVWRAMMTQIGAWQASGISMFSILDKRTGEWLGRAGPWFPHGWPGPEVGWALHRDAWGKGYATEASAAGMDYAFDVLGWDRVIHSIDPANVASARLAERLGSKLIGLQQLPDPFAEAVSNQWGQSQADWQQNRKQFELLLRAQ